MIYAYFLEHPIEKNMTYFQHLKHAWFVGCNLLKSSCVLFIHGVVPKYFPDTGSKIIEDMNVYIHLHNSEPNNIKND
jgi:hypothetical protein